MCLNYNVFTYIHVSVGIQEPTNQYSKSTELSKTNTAAVDNRQHCMHMPALKRLRPLALQLTRDLFI